jgi:hypothetical protein
MSDRSQLTSECQMILDGNHAWNTRGRNSEGISFLLGLHEAEEVYDTVIHDDVLRRHMCPGLFGKVSTKDRRENK